MNANNEFLFRPQRGGLKEAMAEVQTFTSKADLIAEAIRLFGEDIHKEAINEHTVVVKPYMYDKRIGWDTHIVILKAVGPIGYTNKMVK